MSKNPSGDDQLSSANSEDSWANELLNNDTTANSQLRLEESKVEDAGDLNIESDMRPIVQSVGKIIEDGSCLLDSNTGNLSDAFNTKNLEKTNLILDDIINTKTAKIFNESSKQNSEEF